MNKKNEPKKKYIVSFPHLGNYYVPIYNLLNNIIDKETTEILVPKKHSKTTTELGSISSPDFVCTPFKFNMGNFIESLDSGANVIIQAGGGCRYGYYAELQEEILKSMGYDFKYISLLDASGVNIVKLYNKFRELNPNLKLTKFTYSFLLAVKIIFYLDKFETQLRENIVYELDKGSLKKIHKELLLKLKNVNSLSKLKLLIKEFNIKFKNITLDNDKSKYLKVGIVGELYSSMEPYSTFFLEEELTKLHIHTKRYTTVTYLLFEKGRAEKGLLKTAKEYIDYPMGADSTESIAHTLELIDKGYDGIIHIKPFGCTPEINAMPILQKISQDKNIPIMYLTFDMQTSETGIKTRLEAFNDMLLMQKEARENLSLEEVV